MIILRLQPLTRAPCCSLVRVVKCRCISSRVDRVSYAHCTGLITNAPPLPPLGISPLSSLESLVCLPNTSTAHTWVKETAVHTGCCAHRVWRRHFHLPSPQQFPSTSHHAGVPLHLDAPDDHPHHLSKLDNLRRPGLEDQAGLEVANKHT